MTRTRAWVLSAVLLAAGVVLLRYASRTPAPAGLDANAEPASEPAAGAAGRGEQRAPSAPHAPRAPAAGGAAIEPQRALAEVKALVDKGSIGAARALAERYLNELPDGPEATQIKSLTGVHPHP